VAPGVHVQVRHTAGRLMPAGAFAVGRAPECDVQADGDGTVSRLQCLVVPLPGGIVVADAWSAWGTRAPREKCLAWGPQGLAPGKRTAFVVPHGEQVVLVLGMRTSLTLGPLARSCAAAEMTTAIAAQSTTDVSEDTLPLPGAEGSFNLHVAQVAYTAVAAERTLLPHVAAVPSRPRVEHRLTVVGPHRTVGQASAFPYNSSGAAVQPVDLGLLPKVDVSCATSSACAAGTAVHADAVRGPARSREACLERLAGRVLPLAVLRKCLVAVRTLAHLRQAAVKATARVLHAAKARARARWHRRHHATAGLRVASRLEPPLVGVGSAGLPGPPRPGRRRSPTEGPQGARLGGRRKRSQGSLDSQGPPAKRRRTAAGALARGPTALACCMGAA